MSPREEQALLAIAAGGKISPPDVVDAARNQNHPLHHRFIWDDAEAAEVQRLATARTLIREVEVRIVVRNQTIAVPYFVRDPDLTAREAGYVSIRTLAKDPDAVHEALVGEFQRVASALTRARGLAIAFGLEKDVDRLLSEVGVLKSQVTGRRATP
jgi:hypothetical protein